MWMMPCTCTLIKNDMIWVSLRENPSWGGGGGGGCCEQQKGRPDQPGHPCSLISTFVIRFLESMIYKHAIGEIPTF